MTFDRDDFARIRLSLLAAVAMTATGGGLIWATDKQYQAAVQERAAAHAHLNEFKGKLQQVRTEENEIKAKAILFGKLQARGIIGEEQRLDWAELIKEIRDQRKLLDVQYEFAPQQAMDKTAVGDYAFKSSPMRLRMKLLHEGDLLNFIDDLRSRARAHVRVRACNVTRLASSEVASLHAECELEWITILPPVKAAPGTT